ncbi:hypothetical protein SK128_018238 [Halocaridina rubra]|uniref:Uncharacterized protein n=1 Tax=Halocaridina rubra TaxID=373956 RepID=A0AAN8WRM8_HALRR
MAQLRCKVLGRETPPPLPPPKRTIITNNLLQQFTLSLTAPVDHPSPSPPLYSSANLPIPPPPPFPHKYSCISQFYLLLPALTKSLKAARIGWTTSPDVEEGQACVRVGKG